MTSREVKASIIVMSATLLVVIAVASFSLESYKAFTQAPGGGDISMGLIDVKITSNTSMVAYVRDTGNSYLSFGDVYVDGQYITNTTFSPNLLSHGEVTTINVIGTNTTWLNSKHAIEIMAIGGSPPSEPKILLYYNVS